MKKVIGSAMSLSLMVLIGSLSAVPSVQAESFKQIGGQVLNDVLNGNQSDRYGRNDGAQQMLMLDHRADRLSSRLNDAFNSGTINPPQFRWMNGQVRGVIAQIHQMRNTGDTNWQARRSMDQRLDTVEARLNNMTAGRGGWH